MFDKKKEKEKKSEKKSDKDKKTDKKERKAKHLDECPDIAGISIRLLNHSCFIP